MTASGEDVFESDNNWLVLEITASDGSAPFVTTWTATNNDKSITFPGTGSYTIDWGDETSEDVTSKASHAYNRAGTYTVTASGGLEGFNLGSTSQSNARQLASIESWGSMEWESLNNAFQYAVNMEYNDVDAPDLSRVTSTAKMFHDAFAFNADLSGWDTSNVRNMNSMFWGAASFNQDISGWQTSRVTDMRFMFDGATSFDKDLEDWNTPKVNKMKGMFDGSGVESDPPSWYM